MIEDQELARPRSVLDWVRRHGPSFRTTDRSPLYQSMMVLDVAGFGRLANLAQLEVRTALYAALRGAFRGTCVRWSALAVEDRGDGAIVLTPPTVSKVELLDPVIPNLAARIREHNAAADPGRRIRVRVSVHAGEVHRDATGWTDTGLDVACRLVANAVVRHGYRRIDPGTYEPVHVAVKELSARARLHVPF